MSVNPIMLAPKSTNSWSASTTRSQRYVPSSSGSLSASRSNRSIAGRMKLSRISSSASGRTSWLTILRRRRCSTPSVKVHIPPTNSSTVRWPSDNLCAAAKYSGLFTTLERTTLIRSGILPIRCTGHVATDSSDTGTPIVLGHPDRRSAILNIDRLMAAGGVAQVTSLRRQPASEPRQAQPLWHCN